MEGGLTYLLLKRDRFWTRDRIPLIAHHDFWNANDFSRLISGNSVTSHSSVTNIILFFSYFLRKISQFKKKRGCAQLSEPSALETIDISCFDSIENFQIPNENFQICVVFFCNLEKKKDRIADNFKIKIKWEKIGKMIKLTNPTSRKKTKNVRPRIVSQ